MIDWEQKYYDLLHEYRLLNKKVVMLEELVNKSDLVDVILNAIIKYKEN